MRTSDKISESVRSSLESRHLEWLAIQKTALNVSYERLLHEVLSEWVARHPEALRFLQNYGKIMRAALDEFIERHAEEFLPSPSSKDGKSQN